MSGEERSEHRGGGVAFDDRFFPVVVSTWSGVIDPQASVDFFAWLDPMLARAQSEAVPLMLIGDASEIVRPSLAAARRVISGLQLRDPEIKRWVDSMFVVTRRPIIMGMVAHILGALRPGARLSTTATLAAAIDRSLVRLDHLGRSRPAGLERRGYGDPSAA